MEYRKIAARSAYAMVGALPRRRGAVVDVLPTDPAYEGVIAELRRRDQPTLDIGRLQSSGDVSTSSLQRLRVTSFPRHRTVVMTHNWLPEYRPRRHQRLVNLWHGMPVKVIGAAAGDPGVPATTTVAHNEVFRHILSSVLKVPLSTVCNVGHPRIDAIEGILRDGGRLATVNPPRRRVESILWAPTYRMTDPRGLAQDSINVTGLSPNDLNVFVRRLSQAHRQVTIYPHPFAVASALRLVGAFEFPPNVAWLTVTSGGRVRPSVYEEAVAHDLLITDYSSLWIDLARSNIPMVSLVPELDKYRAERAPFCLEPYEEWFPGPVTRSYEAIVELVGSPIDSQLQRRRALLATPDRFVGQSMGRILDFAGHA